MLESYGKEKLDENTLVGCYVFEVARRNFGEEYVWIEEAQQPVLVAGQPDFYVGIKAWEKVRDRLRNGKEDSIPFYLDGYKEHIEVGKKKQGYRAMIV